MQLSMYYYLGDDLWLRLVHILYTLIPRLSAHDRNGEILGGGRGTFFVLFSRVVWARDRWEGERREGKEVGWGLKEGSCESLIGVQEIYRRK